MKYIGPTQAGISAKFYCTNSNCPEEWHDTKSCPNKNMIKLLETKDGEYNIVSPDGDPNKGSYFVPKQKVNDNEMQNSN